MCVFRYYRYLLKHVKKKISNILNISTMQQMKIRSYLFISFVFLTLTMRAGAVDSLRIVSDMQIIRERM